MSRRIPLVGVAATGSGSGKTLVSLLVMEHYRRRGVAVQPFKVGPDFIDPLYHRAWTDRVSPALDGMFCDERGLEAVVDRYARSAQVGVVEGVMGLFDGSADSPGAHSTAEVFAALEVPYLLVIDASGSSHSVAAEVKGFVELDDRIRCLGVVLNRVGSPRHAAMVREAIDDWLEVPVLGWIGRDDRLELPSRHLGLHSGDVASRLRSLEEPFAAVLDRHRGTLRRHLPSPARAGRGTRAPDPFAHDDGGGPVVGVARDEAFQFYYPENLRVLTEAGLRLRSVSPLHDETVPAALDGLYLGGGYPEEHLRELGDNDSFRRALRAKLRAGLPVLAECGGTMYIGRISDGDRTHELVDWFPVQFAMEDRFTALGYVRGRFTAACGVGDEGDRLLGHEFHYSRPQPDPGARFMARLERGTGFGDGREVVRRGNACGLYTHLYLPSCPGVVRRFARSCRRFRKGVVTSRD